MEEWMFGAKSESLGAVLADAGAEHVEPTAAPEAVSADQNGPPPVPLEKTEKTETTSQRKVEIMDKFLDRVVCPSSHMSDGKSTVPK
eukprot:8051335-Pyramimonas_sp.AAC.1